MGEGLHKPRLSQKCLQTLFTNFSFLPPTLVLTHSLCLPMFFKRTKRKVQQRLFTGYKNILNRNI